MTVANGNGTKASIVSSLIAKQSQVSGTAIGVTILFLGVIQPLMAKEELGRSAIIAGITAFGFFILGMFMEIQTRKAAQCAADKVAEQVRRTSVDMIEANRVQAERVADEARVAAVRVEEKIKVAVKTAKETKP